MKSCIKYTCPIAMVFLFAWGQSSRASSVKAQATEGDVVIEESLEEVDNTNTVLMEDENLGADESLRTDESRAVTLPRDTLSTPIQIAPDLQYTKYVIDIANGGFMDKLPDDVRSPATYLRQYFGDLYDFLLFVPQFPPKGLDIAGRSFGFRNDVKNIGASIFGSGTLQNGT